MIRNCVSYNDGRKEKGDSVGFGFVTWGSGLDRCRVDENLAIVTSLPAPKSNPGMLFATYIVGSQQTGDQSHIDSCSFNGNAVLMEADGIAAVHGSFAGSDDRPYHGCAETGSNGLLVSNLYSSMGTVARPPTRRWMIGGGPLAKEARCPNRTDGSNREAPFSVEGSERASPVGRIQLAPPIPWRSSPTRQM